MSIRAITGRAMAGGGPSRKLPSLRSRWMSCCCSDAEPRGLRSAFVNSSASRDWSSNPSAAWISRDATSVFTFVNPFCGLFSKAAPADVPSSFAASTPTALPWSSSEKSAGAGAPSPCISASCSRRLSTFSCSNRSGIRNKYDVPLGSDSSSVNSQVGSRMFALTPGGRFITIEIGSIAKLKVGAVFVFEFDALSSEFIVSVSATSPMMPGAESSRGMAEVVMFDFFE
mmetsp:Transcript_17036/g.42218  ORF Transcript_17036/g.42218 Transcript_17036/m.42218 type:complete len:228 (-) Transcript_17036:2066-2749(-)